MRDVRIARRIARAELRAARAWRHAHAIMASSERCALVGSEGYTMWQLGIW